MTNRRAVIEAFCEECVWARSIRTHFADLFEANEDRRELLSEVANIFFHDLNLILIEYILLQQCKLTDPASSGTDKSNLTSNYILQLDWSDETKQLLSAKNAELMAFREKIINARRKLIAHLDLRARLQPLGLGEFSEAEEEGFWAALQAFVDAAHSEAIGGPYDISATMVDGDVANLIHSLKEAVDYNYLVVAYFAYANPGFNRGRSIYTKTIFHENSLKKGYSEWVHPDMVGFYLPIEDWRPEVIEFNRLSDNNSIRLFSFELKRSLNKSNYRESYFQAVSNSSWAHEGYLVAAEVLQDDDFLAELERLAVSFGIGIVQLEIQDIDSSSVLYPARVRPALDWETINKLCEQNRDFEKFVQDVKIDFESKRIHRAEYDEVPKDAAQYIREKLKIEQAAAADG